MNTAASAATPVRLEGISKRFGSTLAVDRVSLDIPEGRFTTLLGPSGCGKTTTLRIIAGIYSPEEGSVHIGGHLVNDLPPQKRSTAMVFQEYALFPHLSVRENIAYGLKRRRLPKAQIAERVDRMSEFLGLQDLDRQHIGQLSGGQQQRVALARALVLEPAVLLLDEPLSNLDAKIRIKIRTELKQIQQSLGKTTIYVTHDQEEALSISDHIALMDRGRIVQFGTPQEIYYQPADSFAADFIGSANLIEARVAEVTGRGTLLDLGCGRIDVPRPGRRLEQGQAVRLMIRPEFLSLHAGARPRQDELEGTIEARSFMGGLTRYWVRVQAKIWVVDQPSTAAVPAGRSRVRVRVRPEGIHYLGA